MDLTPAKASSEWTNQVSHIPQKPCKARDKFARQLSSDEVRDRTWARRWRTRLYRHPTSAQAPEQLPTPIQDDLSEDYIDREDLPFLEDYPEPEFSHQTAPASPKSDITLEPSPGEDTKRVVSTSLSQWTNRRIHPPSPVTPLQKGNSDPFSSFSVQVTARVTDLIAFGRDVLHPALYVSARQYNPEAVSQTLQQLWQDVSSHLQDKVAAYAYLARSAVLLRSLEPTTSPGQELVFKHLSAKLLRERLAKLDRKSLHTFQTYFVMYALFQVDLFDRNFESAAGHMKMLSTLITEHELAGYEPLPLTFVYRPLYTDASLAAMALIRPHFDPQGPVWKRFDAVRTDMLSSLPDIPPSSLALDASISDENLRSIIIEIKTIAAVRSLVLSDPTYGKPSSWLYAFSQASLCTTRLMTYYDNSLRDCAALESLEGPTLSDYDNQYLALAAVLWIRQLIGIENQPLGTRGRIFAAYPNLLAGMREALTRSEGRNGRSNFSVSNSARLWALFMGAACEEDETKVLAGTAASNNWFQEQFALQAKAMRIRTWQDVRSILERFLYTDEIRPHGSQWVWRILCDDAGVT